MKKLSIIFGIAFLMIFYCSLFASSPIVQLDIEELPLSARNVVYSNFDLSEIVTIQKKTDTRSKVRYTVKSKDGKVAVFNTIGEWISLDWNNEVIPYMLVPSTIRNHIAQKFGPYVHPVAIKKIKKKYRIVLNNHIVLVLK